MIISDEYCKTLVHGDVVKFLQKIKKKKRLEVIAKSDTKPTEH